MVPINFKVNCSVFIIRQSHMVVFKCPEISRQFLHISADNPIYVELVEFPEIIKNLLFLEIS